MMMRKHRPSENRCDADRLHMGSRRLLYDDAYSKNYRIGAGASQDDGRANGCIEGESARRVACPLRAIIKPLHHERSSLRSASVDSCETRPFSATNDSLNPVATRRPTLNTWFRDGNVNLGVTSPRTRRGNQRRPPIHMDLRICLN